MTAPEGAPPLLSVVVYYVLPAPFLSDAIESVLTQTDGRAELIVVAGLEPGADTTLTPELAARIDRLMVEPDQGAWDAANKGWRAARGAWVQFLMSDDLLPTGALARTLAALRQSQADLATGGLVFFRDGDHGRIALRHAPAADLDIKRALGDLCSPAVMYRRELLDRLGGFDARFRYAHDRDLLLRALLSGARHQCLAHDVCWMRHHTLSRTLSGDSAVKRAYLTDHLAIAEALRTRTGTPADIDKRLRLWQDEEQFKLGVFTARALASAQNTSPHLGVARAAAAAWRIGARKLRWTMAKALRRLSRPSPRLH